MGPLVTLLLFLLPNSFTVRLWQIIAPTCTNICISKHLGIMYTDTLVIDTYMWSLQMISDIHRNRIGNNNSLQTTTTCHFLIWPSLGFGTLIYHLLIFPTEPSITTCLLDGPNTFGLVRGGLDHPQTATIIATAAPLYREVLLFTARICHYLRMAVHAIIHKTFCTPGLPVFIRWNAFPWRAAETNLFCLFLTNSVMCSWSIIYIYNI